MSHRSALKTLAIAILAAAIAAAAAAALDAQRMDPPRITTLTRPPQHLRVFFDVLPDPAKSELTLVGPEGELKVEGLHTMGENDLMVRIVGRVADGDYTARWKAVGTDGSTSEGEWKFIVKRAAEARRPRRQPALEALIAASARGLSARTTLRPDRSRPRHRVGCRQPLIRDGTYLAVDDRGLAACGGWSYRNTLFGADAWPAASPRCSIPRTTPRASAPSSCIRIGRGAASARCCSMPASRRHASTASAPPS